MAMVVRNTKTNIFVRNNKKSIDFMVLGLCFFLVSLLIAHIFTHF